MLSTRQVDNILRNQSAVARKVYECTPIQESWPVHQIIKEVKNQNGGNTPDQKVVSGCLNDLTDSGLLRRSGRDLYRRAATRPMPTANNVDVVDNVLKTVIEIEERATTMSNDNILSMPAKAAVNEAPAVIDSLAELIAVAEGMVSVADTIKDMAKQIEDLALALEQERETVKRKSEKIEKLSQALRALQSDI